MWTSSCILSKFYIKPQHRQIRNLIGRRCILSKFYIKPQQYRSVVCARRVVSYRNSTSNHNYRGKKRVVIALYLIEILHQTTTLDQIKQTFKGCILSKFYIKPQLEGSRFADRGVVSYRNSTSNHNVGPHID